jgi:hypothetical protein
MRFSKPSRLAWGLICIALGLLPISIALDWLPVAEASLHAPPWVVALSGAVFLIGGCMILLTNHTWANDLLAALLCLPFGIIAAWAALFGASDAFSGGLPFLSHEANVVLGRWVFGVGAIICFVISAYAARRAIQSSKYFA